MNSKDMDYVREERAGRPGHLAGHLDDDQFADCLMGLEMGPGVASHLSSCEACREEMSRFGGAVHGFSRASLAWSESRSSGTLRKTGSDRWERWTRGPLLVRASWALAACLILGVGAGLVEHRDMGQRAVTGEAVDSQREDSAAQIAQDNQFLTDVDVAIHGNDHVVIQAYGLRTSGDARERARGATRSQ